MLSKIKNWANPFKALLAMRKSLACCDEIIKNQSMEINSLNEKLKTELFIDTLTLLPNRAAFLNRLEQIRPYAVLFININGFKELNNFYGHKVGDWILKRVANKIKKKTNCETSELFRSHADEFILILTAAVRDKSNFNDYCNNLLLEISNSRHKINGINIPLSVTIGASTCPIGGECNSASECGISYLADLALEYARRKKTPFVRYHEKLSLQAEHSNNIKCSMEIRSAIRKNQLLLHYQGIHDIKTKKIIKYEALIRMQKDDGSIASPASFLEVAKKTHSYHKLTAFVVKEIFIQLRNTSNNYSINLSAEDMLSDSLQNLLFEELAKDRSGERLTLEILESDGIENYEDVSVFIARAKEFGCRIAVDDFGTGYSNYKHILRLEIDFIKIDGSLVQGIDKCHNHQIVIETIVSFAQRLGIKTIAEFVSNQEVYDKLIELGVDYAQGYYLSMPAKAIDIADIL